VTSRKRGRPVASRRLENLIRQNGFTCIAGVDEVGRGSIAGSVVASAVIIDAAARIKGLRDSKMLTGQRREEIFAEIVGSSYWSTAEVGPAEIDQINIHNASLKAMRLAVATLGSPVDFVLVDGLFPLPDLWLPQQAVVAGDRKCAAIAAASIVAKVTRDNQMRNLHELYPVYGFDRNKGYATEKHLQAVEKFGYSDVHRHSFKLRGIRKYGLER